MNEILDVSFSCRKCQHLFNLPSTECSYVIFAGQVYMLEPCPRCNRVCVTLSVISTYTIDRYSIATSDKFRIKDEQT